MVCEVAVQPATATSLSSASMKTVVQQDQQQQPIQYFNWDHRQTAKAAVQTLVQALAEDPVNKYFSGKKRVHFVKDEVKGYLKALPGATNFMATQDSKAVALWQLMPQETPRNELLAGWTRIFKVPPRLWRQLLRLEMHYEKAHAEVAADFGSYYYLSFIGTAPEARGKGYGSLLLRAITDRADKEGRWCLLEATSERSEALYARHGFVTYEVYRVGPKAPPVFLMKRAPAGLAAAAAAKTPVTLSAAALDLVAAVTGKAASGPGSDCGSTSSSNLISASMVIDECDAQQSCKLKLVHLEEETETETDTESEVGSTTSRCSFAAATDAAVMVCNSAAAAYVLKGIAEETAEAATAGGDGNIEGGLCDENSNQQSSKSSSSAGAGGPTTVGC